MNASLSTKIIQINKCHILMSYASTNVILCQMTQWHFANLGVLTTTFTPGVQIFGNKLFENVNNIKCVRIFFSPFIHFRKHLYFLLEKEYLVATFPNQLGF